MGNTFQPRFNKHTKGLEAIDLGADGGGCEALCETVLVVVDMVHIAKGLRIASSEKLKEN
jgi:hypothetical protein